MTGSFHDAPEQASLPVAEIVWTEAALADLDAIADYIALDNPAAARALVARVFSHAEQLASQPRKRLSPT